MFTYADLDHTNTNVGDARVTAITMAVFQRINGIRDFEWANWQ